MSEMNVSRRKMLASLGGLGASAALAGCAGATRQVMPVTTVARGAGASGAPRVLRLAHMTDSHIQPERGAFDGVTECLRHAMAQPDRPELVITGGDLIMDGFEQTRERTRAQWDLFTRVFRDECGVPVEHTLGNHDIWGWNQKKSKTTSDEPGWGKQWATDLLGIGSAYRSVRRGAWRIVILDSVAQDRGDGYIAKLDEAQMSWLDSTLGEASSQREHVLIVSHIPILSLTPFDLDSEIEDGQWRIPGGVMHVDAKELLALFRRHRCVRLCLSGHIHMVDRCEFDGVTYICDGAVSGSWWRGPGKRCAEGYGIVDLFEDGSFAHAYEAYGWRAREA